MKRLLIAVPLLLLCCMFACKKAKGPANGKSVQPNNNLDSTVNVSAIINGSAWQTDSAYGYYVKHSGNDSGMSDLMITATSTDKKTGVISTITFNISNFSGPNEYAIAPPYNTATYYIGSMRHFAMHGSFVVATDTGYALRGSFSFLADTFQVSQGVFDVSLP
jgi:hypothetical protein